MNLTIERQVEFTTAAHRRQRLRLSSAEPIESAKPQKSSNPQEGLEKRLNAAWSFLEFHPNGETKTVIRDQGGVGKRYIDQVIELLVEKSEIEPCTFQKNNRTESGFQLTSEVVPGSPGRARGGSRVAPKLPPFDFSEVDYSFV